MWRRLRLILHALCCFPLQILGLQILIQKDCDYVDTVWLYKHPTHSLELIQLLNDKIFWLFNDDHKDFDIKFEHLIKILCFL